MNSPRYHARWIPEKEEKVYCAYCSMPAEQSCEFRLTHQFCLVPMCKKHTNDFEKDHLFLCRTHRAVDLKATVAA